MLSWQLASVALVAAEGTVGLWLSVKTDAPPGATIACRRRRRLRPGRAGAGPGPGAARAALAAAARRPGPGRRRLRQLGRRRGDRLAVVATTTQIGDFVREVGGDAVEVDQILEPNTDPHEYEPRPSDVATRPTPKLVFASGDGLDDWVDEVVSESGSDAEVVDLGAVVPVRSRARRAGTRGQLEHDSFDPHWWHDPRNAAAAVREIERRLAAADPAKKPVFAAQRRRLPRRAARPSTPGSPRAWPVPAAERKLVTDHDAFGYFADRYGIDVVGAVDPLADHPGPALGQGPERAGADDRGRARQRGVPGELAEPEGRGSDRRARPGPRSTTRSTATRSARTAPTAPPTCGWRRPTPTRWCAASPAGGDGCLVSP